jgi:putative ABC transport system ATP-binding protein
LTALQSTAAIRVTDLSFAWPKQKPLYTNVSFELYPGEKFLITGPSGCGKSTLLNLLAGVVKPSAGEIWILDRRIQALSQTATDQLRGEQMGFIFQQFNLLPYLSVRDNILLPAHLFTKRKAAALAQFGSLDDALRYYMNHLGLSQELEHQPAHLLSIGQQQRVAAARAFMGVNAVFLEVSGLDIDLAGCYAQELDPFHINVGCTGTAVFGTRIRSNGRTRRCGKIQSGYWDFYASDVDTAEDWESVAPASLTDPFTTTNGNASSISIKFCN